MRLAALGIVATILAIALAALLPSCEAVSEWTYLSGPWEGRAGRSVSPAERRFIWELGGESEEQLRHAPTVEGCFGCRERGRVRIDGTRLVFQSVAIAMVGAIQAAILASRDARRAPSPRRRDVT